MTFALFTDGSVGAGASFLGGGAQATGTTGRLGGVATSPPLVANDTAGLFLATATTSGLAADATFALENRAATTTVAAARATLHAVVGGRYAERLSAHVLDAAGQPVVGASVTFAIAAAAGGAGATFLGGGATATVVADANGVATSPALVANGTAGSFTATASVAGAAPAAFSLANRAGAASAVAAGAAASESASVGARFPVRLAVTVTDAKGNPVAGALVTFAAPAHGASGRFAGGRRVARLRTDADGIAVAPAFTANRTAGGYAVRATVRGAAAAGGLRARYRARA